MALYTPRSTTALPLPPLWFRLLGPRVLEVVSGTLNKWTSNIVPQWNPYIPKVGVARR